MDSNPAFLLGAFVGCAVGLLASWFLMRAAYFNGVTDGYGYSAEPMNKGYKEAGKYLRDHMSGRWPELDDRFEGDYK